MKIAVVIPAHNESKHIVDVLRRLQSCKTAHTLMPIVVDDGSSDTTRRKARTVSGVTVLHHRINLGKGAAAKTGCDAAYRMGANIIVLMDADGQHSPEDLCRMIEPLIFQKDTSITIGTRAINQNMPIAMRCGNMLLTVLSKVFFNIRVRDTQSGFRAFTSDIYPSIRWKASSYAMETEMLILASRYKHRAAEVAIDTIYLNSYKGTTVLDGMRIFGTLLKWRLLWYREFRSLESFSV